PPSPSRPPFSVTAPLPTASYLLPPPTLSRSTRPPPAASPGYGPLRLVAFVGNGTVSVVAPLNSVARAWPSTVPPPLRKFTTGTPKPLLLKPWPAIVNDTGALARSIRSEERRVGNEASGRAGWTE